MLQREHSLLKIGGGRESAPGVHRNQSNQAFLTGLSQDDRLDKVGSRQILNINRDLSQTMLSDAIESAQRLGSLGSRKQSMPQNMVTVDDLMSKRNALEALDSMSLTNDIRGSLDQSVNPLKEKMDKKRR